jgi:uncharacterized membrane protein YphA (DoxX/SURF4 family)
MNSGELMIIALWIVTGLLAVAFFGAGLMKLSQPQEKLQANMAWVEAYSATQVRTVGALEALGAIGLVLPAATGILAWLTPVAAFALALTMAFATALHITRKETPLPSIVIGVVALAVGIGWVALG